MLTFLLALALLPKPQTPEAKSPPVAEQASAVDAKLAASLAASVRALDAGRGLYLVGAVREAKPAEAEDDDRGGMQIMIGGVGEEVGEPYHGGLEVLLTEKKELLLASMGSLPEVVVYSDGVHRLVRTTIAEKNVSTRRMTDDLGSLLGFAELATKIEACTRLSASAPAADGARSFECELSPRAIRADDEAGPMAPKVLAVTARIELDAKGAVASMEFSVTRSDPIAGLRRGARRGGPPAGANGERIVQFGGPMSGSDEPGPTAVYLLRPSGDVPSAHARESLFALRKLAEKK